MYEILIEGRPGSGKSQRAQNLKAKYKSDGFKVCLEDEPGLFTGATNKPDILIRCIQKDCELKITTRQMKSRIEIQCLLELAIAASDFYRSTDLFGQDWYWWLQAAVYNHMLQNIKFANLLDQQSED